MFWKKKEQAAPVKKAKKATKKVAKSSKKTVKKKTTKAKTSPAKKKVAKKMPEQPVTKATLTTAEPQKNIRAPTREEIRQKREAGWLRTMIVFELAGKPKEHVEQTLKAYIANINNDSRILSINEDYADTEEHEDGMFSAFVEMEAQVKDLETLTWLAVNFMPASIEVLDPNRLEIESRVLVNWYNDLLAKLHEASGILREERAINKGLTASLNAIIKNSILLAAPATVAQMEKKLGISKSQLEPFLAHLVEKGKLAKKGEEYVVGA